MIQISKVDVKTELEKYNWEKTKWTGGKLVAASPFRYDKNPSFFVDLREDSEYYGCWHDSGAIEEEWRSGNFVKLLSFLRQETYQETLEYLEIVYGEDYSGEINLPPLNLNSPSKTKKETLSEDILTPYNYNNSYLTNRGIDVRVQKYLGIGYDPNTNAITIPWRTSDGKLANVKFRKTDSKVFWYIAGGLPLRELVYSLDVIYKRKPRLAVITEGEVDAMSFMTCGYPAVALGNAKFTESKAEQLIKSPVETFYICTDHDSAGKAVRNEIINRLKTYKKIYVINLPKDCKDANEALCKRINLKTLVEQGTSVLENERLIVL